MISFSPKLTNGFQYALLDFISCYVENEYTYRIVVDFQILMGFSTF